MELLLDDDLHCPIQSELVLANMGVFFPACDHWPFLMAVIGKLFFFSAVVRGLEKLIKL